MKPHERSGGEDLRSVPSIICTPPHTERGGERRREREYERETERERENVMLAWSSLRGNEVDGLDDGIRNPV